MIIDLGPKAPSDGLAADERGAIYAGDYEHGSIRKFAAGHWTTIARDPRIKVEAPELALGTRYTLEELRRGHAEAVARAQRVAS